VWLRKKALSGSATDYAFSSPHLDTIEHLMPPSLLARADEVLE
jgi:hypothetical protein